MSKKTVLERAYFHINNGGITISLVERVDVRRGVCYSDYPEGKAVPRDAAEQDLYNRTWRCRVAMNHSGTDVGFDFPLVPSMVRWAIEALGRVLVRMETPQDKPTDGIEWALRDKVFYVRARNGERVDEYNGPPRGFACSMTEEEAAAARARDAA